MGPKKRNYSFCVCSRAYVVGVPFLSPEPSSPLVTWWASPRCRSSCAYANFFVKTRRYFSTPNYANIPSVIFPRYFVKMF